MPPCEIDLRYFFRATSRPAASRASRIPRRAATECVVAIKTPSRRPAPKQNIFSSRRAIPRPSDAASRRATRARPPLARAPWTRGRSTRRARVREPRARATATARGARDRATRSSGTSASASARRRRVARRAADASDAGDDDAIERSRDVVLFAYDAVVDATVEMTRVSHAVARERWPDNVPGDASSYVEAMRTMRRAIAESTSCEAVVMVRVIADEAIIGGRTTSGGRPGPVFSNEQRFERRTRPLTVDEIVSSWPEIKLMSVLKWGEEVESSVGWDGRRMMPAGLQASVDARRMETAADGEPGTSAGEQVVYEDLKPLLHAALARGSKVFVLNSRGRAVE